MFTPALSKCTITIHRYQEAGPVVYLNFLWLLTNPFTSPSVLDLSFPLCPLSCVPCRKQHCAQRRTSFEKKIITSFLQLQHQKTNQKQKHAYPEALLLYSLSVGCLNTCCIAKHARRWLSFHAPTPLCYLCLCSSIDEFVCAKSFIVCTTHVETYIWLMGICNFSLGLLHTDTIIEIQKCDRKATGPWQTTTTTKEERWIKSCSGWWWTNWKGAGSRQKLQRTTFRSSRVLTMRNTFGQLCLYIIDMPNTD